MKAHKILATLIILGLAACAGSPASRISEKQADFDHYPSEAQQKIRAGQVDVGFTPDMVHMALGEPSRKYTRTTAQGASEVWAYRDNSPNISFGIGGASFGGSSALGGGVGLSTGPNDEKEDRVRVVFENGAVISVERALQ